MAFLFDLYRTLRFATRLPLPQLAQEADDPIVGADAFAPAFTLCGVLVGAAGGLVVALLVALSATPLIAATVGVATMIVLTGALHEDGLADCADGIGGGRTMTRKLEIMRDSAIGTYGTLALVLSVSARIAAVASLAAFGVWAALLGLIVSQTASRAMAMLLANRLPHARPDGAAAALGRPSDRASGLALVIGMGGALALLVLWLGPNGGFATWLAIANGIIIVAFGVGRMAKRHIGGQTGDVLGAVQQLTDLAALLVLSISISILS